VVAVRWIEATPFCPLDSFFTPLPLINSGLTLGLKTKYCWVIKERGGGEGENTMG